METIISISVDCVAIGYGHLDRAPVSIGVVDGNGDVIMDRKMKTNYPVCNYLTALNGFDESTLVNAQRFADVKAELLSHLGPQTILVGQGIQNDIWWMQVSGLLFQPITFSHLV